MKSLRRLAGFVVIVTAVAAPAAAQHLDVTLFVGRAFPVGEDRLVFRAPSVPSLPGVDIAATGTPELRTDGGAVYGGAVALEFGILAIEGRLDSTAVGFDVGGARYDLRAVSGPYAGLTGRVDLGDGRIDLERLNLLSLNLRLRTPGPVSFIASGGLSYLPDITTDGSVPVALQLAGLPVLPTAQPRLTLVATPNQSAHRWGVNGGAGIRVGGRVAVTAEARIFYFRSYTLRFAVDDPVPFLNDLVGALDVIEFEPIILNAQVGISFRF